MTKVVVATVPWSGQLAELKTMHILCVSCITNCDTNTINGAANPSLFSKPNSLDFHIHYFIVLFTIEHCLYQLNSMSLERSSSLKYNKVCERKEMRKTMVTKHAETKRKTK